MPTYTITVSWDGFVYGRATRLQTCWGRYISYEQLCDEIMQAYLKVRLWDVYNPTITVE